MQKTLFDFDSYKEYLRHLAGPRTQRSGVKVAMAQALRCQPAYISQILHGAAHLSLEQADQLNVHLGHSEEEAEWLLLQVQRERAGTPSLERYFAQKLEALRKKRLNVASRLGPHRTLSREEQFRYYSSWHYAAIHVALSVPGLRTPKALAKYFRVPLRRVLEVLEFLEKIGVAHARANGTYETGESSVRLGNDSPNILRHHANWRQQAIESLDRERDREDASDLHYSGVLTLSERDAARLKDRMLARLKEDLEIVRASPEEEVYVYCLDLFQMER